MNFMSIKRLTFKNDSTSRRKIVDSRFIFGYFMIIFG